MIRPSAAFLRRCATCLCAALTALATGSAAASVYLEELTSTELQRMIANGTTVVLVPIGGTEQSGAHLVLGKHNVRARLLAGRIAEALGNAVVAPVIGYVPEGAIRPPTGHMRYAGTISVPDAAFDAILAATARSFKQHGFRDVFFLGDHGDYQGNEARVATALEREWKGDPSCRVHALPDYYRAAQQPFDDDLRQRGFTVAEIGTHAGLADTSLSLALDPALVRVDAMKRAPADGVRGDPRRATAELGLLGVRRIVDASVAAIRRLEQTPSTPRTGTP